jgi:hypothetical protein
VLQLLNWRTLLHLERFLNDPNTHLASGLVAVPFIAKVLAAEFSTTRTFDQTTLGFLRWICQSGQRVLKALIKYEKPPREKIDAGNMSWRTVCFPYTLCSNLGHIDILQKTGSCYGMPQIRYRPAYPHLKNDLTEIEDRGGKCSKFYGTYGQARLTGGISVAWCTHSVCLGFHCIPSAEGRNDVFSALLLHWPVAPKHVIYDFACALGPYCMLREPDFFADTMFLIDNFHSQGHTKCSRAAFLSTYAALDPQLGRINSSAAECGNSGIKRIRKSVSYMSQARAILYTKVFLSVWNRVKILRMKQ